MTKFLITLQSFVNDRLGRDERGASAVEYAILIGVIVVVVVAAVWIFGEDLKTFFGGMLDNVNPGTNPNP